MSASSSNSVSAVLETLASVLVSPLVEAAIKAVPVLVSGWALLSVYGFKARIREELALNSHLEGIKMQRLALNEILNTQPLNGLKAATSSSEMRAYLIELKSTVSWFNRSLRGDVNLVIECCDACLGPRQAKKATLEKLLAKASGVEARVTQMQQSLRIKNAGR